MNQYCVYLLSRNDAVYSKQRVGLVKIPSLLNFSGSGFYYGSIDLELKWVFMSYGTNRLNLS